MSLWLSKENLELSNFIGFYPIGICPSCDCTISTFKTNNYKRFAKCEICGLFYALPKRGSISNSALLRPRTKFPLLIVEKKDHKAYFWTDQHCFSCVKYDQCKFLQS